MSAHRHIRGLARPLLLALSLLALAVALAGPSETFAQTHRTSCSSSHAKGRRATRTCPQASHKTATRPAAKRRVKRHAKARSRHGAHGSKAKSFVPAVCEDGSPPVLGAEGSFSCQDGSEPLCEDGATPARSGNGESLVCAMASEPEATGGEAECEEPEAEEGSSCSVEAQAGEQACEASLCEVGS
jgi:hypothetical protein